MAEGAACQARDTRIEGLIFEDLPTDWKGVRKIPADELNEAIKFLEEHVEKQQATLGKAEEMLTSIKSDLNRAEKAIVNQQTQIIKHSTELKRYQGEVERYAPYHHKDQATEKGP